MEYGFLVSETATQRKVRDEERKKTARSNAFNFRITQEDSLDICTLSDRVFSFFFFFPFFFFFFFFCLLKGMEAELKYRQRNGDDVTSGGLHRLTTPMRR